MEVGPGGTSQLEDKTTFNDEAGQRLTARAVAEGMESLIVHDPFVCQLIGF